MLFFSTKYLLHLRKFYISKITMYVSSHGHEKIKSLWSVASWRLLRLLQRDCLTKGLWRKELQRDITCLSDSLILIKSCKIIRYSCFSKFIKKKKFIKLNAIYAQYKYSYYRSVWKVYFFYKSVWKIINRQEQYYRKSFSEPKEIRVFSVSRLATNHWNQIQEYFYHACAHLHLTMNFLSQTYCSKLHWS